MINNFIVLKTKNYQSRTSMVVFVCSPAVRDRGRSGVRGQSGPPQGESIYTKKQKLESLIPEIFFYTNSLVII